jgi:cobalt transporter subunit CbtB
MTTLQSTQSISVPNRALAGVVCLALGAFIVYAAGFSHMGFAHNAAHDTRHAIGFPCH